MNEKEEIKFVLGLKLTKEKMATLLVKHHREELDFLKKVEKFVYINMLEKRIKYLEGKKID